MVLVGSPAMRPITPTLERKFYAQYKEFFDQPYPARTSVQAGLPPNTLVEIEVVARRAS